MEQQSSKQVRPDWKTKVMIFGGIVGGLVERRGLSLRPLVEAEQGGTALIPRPVKRQRRFPWTFDSHPAPANCQPGMEE